MIGISEDDLRRFAPKARREYVTAIIGGLPDLRQAGILENSHRVCHFLAQCAHETGGFTIIRESLNYTTVKRVRKNWPARFRAKSDAEIAGLLRNERALGDAVYLGRMGNVQPGDGYEFRGGGFLQTTGRGAVAKYCQVLGLEPSGSLLDDVPTTLQFACIEWSQAGCNTLADTNDIRAVSRAINVGSATSSVEPVGMDDRKRWFAKAWAIWGDKGKADAPAEAGVSPATVAKIAGTGLAGVEGARQVAPLMPAPPDLSAVAAWKGVIVQGQELLVWAGGNLTWVLGAGAVYLVLGVALPMLARSKA